MTAFNKCLLCCNFWCFAHIRCTMVQNSMWLQDSCLYPHQSALTLFNNTCYRSCVNAWINHLQAESVVNDLFKRLVIIVLNTVTYSYKLSVCVYKAFTTLSAPSNCYVHTKNKTFIKNFWNACSCFV